MEDQPPPRPRLAPGDIGVPPDRSPFEQDLPGGAAPGVAPLPRGNAPRNTPAPRGLDDPFRDMNNPQGATTPRSRNRSQARNAPTAPDGGAPALSAPAAQPGAGAASRSARDDDGEDPPAGNEGPLLGLSDSDLIRSDSGGSATDAPAGMSAVPVADAAPGDVVAAPRRPPSRAAGSLATCSAAWARTGFAGEPAGITAPAATNSMRDPPFPGPLWGSFMRDMAAGFPDPRSRSARRMDAKQPRSCHNQRRSPRHQPPSTSPDPRASASTRACEVGRRTPMSR